MKCPMELKDRLNEIELNSRSYFALTNSEHCDEYLQERFMEGGLVLVCKDGVGAMVEPNQTTRSLLWHGTTVDCKTFDAYE